MYKATVEGIEKAFEIEFKNEDAFLKGKIDNQDFEWDLVDLGNGNYHLIYNYKSYDLSLLAINKDDKTATIKVNNNTFDVSIKDKFDLLLKKLGMENMANTAVKEIKAPMPGLVLEIKSAIGQEVKKGDTILILEAMKMENVIKSPGDGKIASIKIEKGQAVEKNQLMISFE